MSRVYGFILCETQNKVMKTTLLVKKIKSSSSNDKRFERGDPLLHSPVGRTTLVLDADSHWLYDDISEPMRSEK